jgi:hypothetical protein
MHEMRRDVDAMLYWALRWHEGRRVSDAALCDVLWGEFANKPRNPTASLRELMAYVQQRHGDKWTIEDCGRAFRILPRPFGVPRPGAPKTKSRETASLF